jgi:hypothetical protein
MAIIKDAVQWQTVTGDSVTIGDATVTPQSQALTIRWPNGGMVWNRPVAVWVERNDETERIPVTDVMLLAQLGLLGASLLFSMITILVSTRRRRN